MIAVDTNVLVRLLIGDDAAQAEAARALFDAAADRRESIWIGDTVVVETVWTLTRAYGRPRADVVTALRALGANATIVLESAAAVAAATDLYERGPADFADCLLCVKASALGCAGVATFDRGMRSLPGIRVL